MNKAYTLIELLVVLAIMTISLGTGYTVYTSSTQAKLLLKEALHVENLLVTAKQKTLSKDISGNPGCTEFRGYDVQVVNAAVDTYRLRFICRVSGVDTYTNILPDFTLTGTSLSTASLTVPFYYPFGCLSNAYPNSNCNAAIILSIKIRSSGLSNKCITISVSRTGTITTGNPGAC